MDIRCDRCETEYELDDAIVTDTGTSVQCTTCGHTFVVTRRVPLDAPQLGSTPPADLAQTLGPDIPEWTLSTDDGKVHRFRDLNILQKWIVERKVTRTERVSRGGGHWVALGDLVELAPFFSVVDQADRARPADGSRGATSFPPAPGLTPPIPGRRGPEPVPSAIAPGGGAGPASISARPPVSEDGPTVPNRRLPDASGGRVLPREGIRSPESEVSKARASGSRAAGAAASPGGGNARQSFPDPRAPFRNDTPSAPEVTAQTHGAQSDLVSPLPRSRRGVFAVVALALVLAAAGVWWWATQQRSQTASHRPAAPRSSSVIPATAMPSPRAPAGTTDSSRGGPARQQTGPVTGSRGMAITPLSGATGGKGPSSIPSRKDPTASSGPPGGARGSAAPPMIPGPGSSGAAAVRGRGPTPSAALVADGSDRTARTGRPAATGSYEQLVGEADRLLERGKSAQAEKLYAQALATRPDGVAALTGSAYVLLDRQRHFKAIETFRRALAIEPTYGPALFGIGESYRARGDAALALGVYRQYLQVAPSGTDAPAARRQIAELEAAGVDEQPVHERPAAPAREPP
jgi:predicted Zn finger-like uncharacterized protein